MNGLDLLETQQWSLSGLFGYDHPFLNVNSKTLINTWIVLALLLAIVFFLRLFLNKKGSMIRFVTLEYARFFIDWCNQAIGEFSFNHVTFIMSLFTFILLCNTISSIPWLEEPTTDINTALALGCISFVYAQVASILALGLWEYIKGFFSPFFLMLPLNIIGRLATVVSISFRLFGNMFGGSIISAIYSNLIRKSVIFQLAGIFSGFNLAVMLFFGVFEGSLQAFVFTMLSLTYLAIALQGGGH
jgi:F-type H+-transporting ATPase subunit a